MRRFLLTALLLGVLTLSGVAAENARVWVQFSPGQKAAVLGQVQAAGGVVHYEFDNLQAIAVTVPEPALQGISRNPNVVLVEEDPVRVLFASQTTQVTPYGVDMVLQSEFWTPPAHGVQVGVIDSGVYAQHDDLKDTTINGTDDSGAGPWNQDGSGHGTHVVGTILAANNDLGVVGVVPNASVHMVRVFGDSGTWAYSSTLVDAVDKAVNAGSKVISMSLGGSFKSITEQRAFDKHYSQGILLVAAAGNDGTSRMSYPASYSSVISVAAVDQSKAWADFSQYNSQVELAAPGVGVLSTVPYIDEATVTVGSSSFHGSHIENAKRDSATGVLVNGGKALSTDSSWSGKVVLVERGDISFYDKVMNVQNSGGVAAVIYNNAAGAFSGTLGDGNSSTIPAIAISQEDGVVLLGKFGQSATVSSVFTPSASGYAYYDGTSMATPHVSGVAALLWGAFPDKSNVEIRTALQNTAEDLGSVGRDNFYGYGLVRAKAAYDSLNGSSGGGGTGDDTTPPEMSEATVIKVNAKKFRVEWTTNEPAKSTVRVGNKTYTSTSYATSHSFTVSGTSGAPYTRTSADQAGNTATDNTGTLP